MRVGEDVASTSMRFSFASDIEIDTIREEKVGDIQTESSRHQRRSSISTRRSRREFSSISEKIETANAGSSDNKLLKLGATIGMVVVLVHSLVYFAVDYGMFRGKLSFSQYSETQTCLSALKESKFDVLNTKTYEKWMDETTILDLAEIGPYIGPGEIRQYVEFVDAEFFSFFKRSSGLQMTPMFMTDDYCSVNFVTTHKLQVKKEFNSGNVCLETVVGTTLEYTPKPFKVKKMRVFHQSEFLSNLFGTALDTDAVRDYVCDVMEANCPETMELNSINGTTSCRSEYDKLNSTGPEGYLDDNTKGCRIIHSAFASMNSDHCPHLSFVPQEDFQGNIKCQTSEKKRPEDFFSGFELQTIKNVGRAWGFDETLTRACLYDPKAKDEERYFAPTFDFAETVPTESLNDLQFQVYVGFVMYLTMLFAGLGMEYFVWRMLLSGEWNHDKEWKWKVAQFVFPILGATTIGLANSGNFLAMPFLVITMWKLGFPETIMHFYSAMYDKSLTKKRRFHDFVIGMGTIVHHSSSALYVAMLVAHVLPSNRDDVVAVTLPLVMQHWVVLLKYDYNLGYIIFECIIEAWWEWTAFSTFPAINELHWSGGIILVSMLFAHWCYFGGGIFRLIALREEEDDDAMLDERLNFMILDKQAERLNSITHTAKTDEEESHI